MAAYEDRGTGLYLKRRTGSQKRLLKMSTLNTEGTNLKRGKY